MSKLKKVKNVKKTLYYEVIRHGDIQRLEELRVSKDRISYLTKKLSKELKGVDKNMIQIYPYHQKWKEANVSLNDEELKPLRSLENGSGFYGTEVANPLIVVIPYVKYGLSLGDIQEVKVRQMEVSWTEKILDFKMAVIKECGLSKNQVTIKLNGKELADDELLINFYEKFLEISIKSVNLRCCRFIQFKNCRSFRETLAQP